MNPHAKRASEIEAAFLAGAENNLSGAKGTLLHGTRWAWRTVTQDERVRELMSARRQYDRERLREIPKSTARVLTGTIPKWFIGYRRSNVAIAAMLTPPEDYVDENAAPQSVGLATLMDFVKGLVGEADVPHLVGICSPTGFTAEVKRGGIELNNVTLVLVEPRGEGGWNVMAASPNASPVDCKLFDPEAMANKIQRVREEITSRSVDLLTGGLSASAMGERLGVPTKVVAAAFEQASAVDRELRISRHHEDVLLYRGAPVAAEGDDMSMVEWIRQIFGGEGNEARKINALSERRARLVQRRERLYADVGQLETREADLLKQGRETTSPAVKRRVASQIKQLRDDMGRLNGAAQVLGQQVDVISTHIHNLTLLQQGQMAKLPTSEELTADAVRAEEMLEQLGSDVQLATSLSVGTSAALTSEDEQAILRELEMPAAPEAAPASGAKAAPAAAENTPPQKASPQRSQPEAG